MASTAESTVPCAVMMMTGTSGLAALDGAEHLHAAHLGHHQVGDDDVRAVLVELGEPLLAVGGDGDVIALTPQHGGEHLAQVCLVVEDQDLGHARFHGLPATCAGAVAPSSVQMESGCLMRRMSASSTRNGWFIREAPRYAVTMSMATARSMFSRPVDTTTPESPRRRLDWYTPSEASWRMVSISSTPVFS